MRQKHSWSALVALLIILIDSHAQNLNTLNKNDLKIVSDNHNNRSSRAFTNNQFDEFYGNGVEDVKKKNGVNNSLNEFNSISEKSNSINDKKLIVAGVDGSVFSYPLSLHRRRMVDGGYWPTANNLSRSTLLMRPHTDMNFSQLPREIVRKQQFVHVTTELATHSTIQRVKDDTHIKNNVNSRNKTAGEIEAKYWHMINGRNEKNTATEKSPVKYEIPSGKIFTSNQFVQHDISENQTNINIENTQTLSSKRIINPFNDKTTRQYYQTLSVDKDIKRGVMKTSDTTLRVPLKVFANPSPSPPCVKPSEKIPSDEESRNKNQAIKLQQQMDFPVYEEFSRISVIIETFSPTTQSNNEDHRDNNNSEKILPGQLNYNMEQRDVTSASTTSKLKISNRINNKKKSAVSKISLTLNPEEIDEESLFASERKLYKKKVTPPSIVRRNKSSNTITSKFTTSKDHQHSSHINGQLGHSNQVLLPSESYHIRSVSTLTNPRSSDIQEPAQSSIIKSNRKLQSDANTWRTVELYSGDYITYEEDTRNIIPLETTVTTATNIENLTSQIATVTLSDKELLGTVDASETTVTTETLHPPNPTKPKLKWSMLSDNVGPVISALSTDHKKLLPEEHANLPQISQLLQRDGINEIAFSDSAHANVRQHLSNTTFNDNYERDVIASEYRLSIPLANSQLNVTQRGREIGDMKIQSFDVASSDTNVDNTTVKSTISNYPQIEDKKWNGIKWNKHDSVTSLSTNVNGISDRMFNDSANRMSLSTPENVLTIVHSDTRTLGDRSGELENSTRISLNQWPVKHSAIVEGNLVLGGLMMVHEREDTVTCGPVMAQGGVQALEAMLYTLDWLNERDIVPGVKIGAHILDDCDKDTYGLEMAVDFIKGSISNIDGAEYNCNKTTVRKVISGVVGAASSVTSIQVANLLRLFRIPQVSFFSTSPELSNKQRFEYFTRTIPSDHHQVQAMVDIIMKMGWSYVSIIYEESNYGIKAYEELEDLLAKNQICIAIKEKLVKDSGVADAYAYDNIVQKLLTKPRARGCIIFGSDQEVAGVMRAVRRNNATGAFYWIGSDGWSARGLVSNKNEPEVEGTLSVQPQANPVEGFEEYFLNLTVENNKRNPWFFEFWEDHFQCRYPNTSLTPHNQKYKTPCTTKERLTKQNTAFEDQLQFVSDAVMAFAYAFRDMHADLCHGKSGLCDAMRPTKGTELLKYLRKVEFQGLSGDNFHFDKNGDGPARYNIIHFKQISPGKYKWIRVGKYLEGELRLNMSEIQFRLDNSQAPESVCSLPCRVGQAKKYVEGESCCWHCLDCTQYQIRHETDQTRCIPCPWGTLPDETHSYCRDIPEEFLKPDSGWAIGAMSFSASGILITLFVGGVFVKHNDTPIVRASGRELSYVLLTGILLCYLVTFTLVLKPTDVVCGIQRFAAGFCFTVVYAALLTKTNRISRIFNKSKKSAKRPSFISPRSQLIICSLLVGIQILINAVWMVIDPAKARHHYPMREDNLLVCNSYIDASYMIAFSYPIILIVVCTVYAVLTRKIPEDFNESKHIGFTMYTTCIIWLAFVPLYFGTGNHVALRITSMSVTISLSASVTIACLFSPKLYIILIHPERNIRRGRGPFAPKSTTNITRTNASSMISTVTLTAATCDQNKAVKAHTIATTDCSTQSELYEMEMRDRKNGKLLLNLITRSTQTLMNNNGKEINVVLSPTIKDIDIKESFGSVKSLNLPRIGNGPVNQNDVVL